MKKARICFFSPNAYALFNSKSKSLFGGAELQSYLLASELSKDLGFDVHFVVVHNGSIDDEKFGNLALHKIIKPRTRILKRFLFLKNLWFLLHRINADIYHLRAPGVEVGIIALFCLIKRKKFVYMTASENELENMENHTYLTKIMYKYGITHSSVILTQSFNQSSMLLRQYNIKGIIVKNMLFIPPKRTRDNVLFDVLWVGSSQPLKQPNIFLRLANEMSDLKFVMIMPRHEKNNSFFEEICEGAKAISNLKIIEGVPFDQINEYFRSSAIFVNTSRHEGFPNTFVQACSVGTPIASLVVNPDNFLDTYGCGYCASDDFSRLKSLIIKMLRNKQLYNSMSENAYSYAESNHNIKIIVEQYKRILSTLNNQ